MKQWHARYYTEHKQERKERLLSLEVNSEIKTKHKERLSHYQKSPNGMASKIKYRRSQKYKAVIARHDARRRSYGYRPLNQYYLNSVGHHINDVDVIFIPTDIHSGFSHPNKSTHREYVLKYYGNIENMINNKPLSKQE